MIFAKESIQDKPNKETSKKSKQSKDVTCKQKQESTSKNYGANHKSLKKLQKLKTGILYIECQVQIFLTFPTLPRKGKKQQSNRPRVQQKPNQGPAPIKDKPPEHSKAGVIRIGKRTRAYRTVRNSANCLADNNKIQQSENAIENPSHR